LTGLDQAARFAKIGTPSVHAKEKVDVFDGSGSDRRAQKHSRKPPSMHRKNPNDDGAKDSPASGAGLMKVQ
jgi:hypothetical protein